MSDGVRALHKLADRLDRSLLASAVRVECGSEESPLDAEDLERMRWMRETANTFREAAGYLQGRIQNSWCETE